MTSSLEPDSNTPSNPPRNGSTQDARGAAPDDTRIAIVIIGGIVVMFLVGFLLLVVSMASDWR